MSVIGPRPQLVRDMVFMTPEQRMRHTAKPGLSGLAQVNGRNAISWEDKIIPESERQDQMVCRQSSDRLSFHGSSSWRWGCDWSVGWCCDGGSM